MIEIYLLLHILLQIVHPDSIHYLPQIIGYQGFEYQDLILRIL